MRGLDPAQTPALWLGWGEGMDSHLPVLTEDSGRSTDSFVAFAGAVVTLVPRRRPPPLPRARSLSLKRRCRVPGAGTEVRGRLRETALSGQLPAL